MKKLNLISAVTVILAFTIVIPIFAQPQGVETPTLTDSASKPRPAISRYIIAYHDIKEKSFYDYEEGLTDILFFIYESFDNRILLGTDSDNSASVLLNDMVQKVELASELLEYGFFEKACQELSEVFPRSDSLNENSSLVYGPAVPELAKKIGIFKKKVIECE